MIKVCHMTCAHGSEDVRIFHKECSSLARKGYDVSLVQRGDSYEKNRVHIVGAGNLSNSKMNRIFISAKTVYNLALQLDADIYHFHDPELLPYGVKLKRLGKIVVFDSHEDFLQLFLERDYIPHFLRKPLQYIFKKYLIYAIKRFDAIITVTPHIENFYRLYNPNTVGVANYPIINQISRHPHVDGIRLFFAGGISRQWNHEAVIQAIAHIPDCTYELCGPVEPTYYERLSKLPGWKKVNYLGKIPHSEVFTRMRSASIGVALLSPSRNTDYKNGTMGNTKIFEEMAAGLPVICTDFVLWEKFVKNYNCGIAVNPSDPSSICEAIKFLSTNSDEAYIMGQNGQRAIKNEFNWSCEEKKLLHLYDYLGAKLL